LKTRIYAVFMIVLSVLLAASAWNGARAAVRWVHAPVEARGAGRPTPRSEQIRVGTGSRMEPLARTERAIVFVFSPGCAVSRSNMANWTQIVRNTRGTGVAIYAVGPAPADSAAAYWGALARHVRVLSVPAEEIQRTLGVRTTPVTLTVQEGRIISETQGPLRAEANRALVGFAARPKRS
jgi:hypothetical protein